MQFTVEGKKLIVPEGIITIGFKEINDYMDKYAIEEISLPNSLQIIAHNAFYDYPNIKKINVPMNVKKIESQAFWGLDDLEELIISDTIFYVGKYAFCNCKKLKLTIIGESQTVPSNWDSEFADNIGEIYFERN